MNKNKGSKMCRHLCNGFVSMGLFKYEVKRWETLLHVLILAQKYTLIKSHLLRSIHLQPVASGILPQHDLEILVS
jgi:hypothetical protein